MGFVFVDSKCPNCNGKGCPHCYFTGSVGSYEERPDIPECEPTPFGEKLREERLKREIGYMHLSKIFNCTPSHVCNLERGCIDPTEEEIEIFNKFVENN